MLLGRLRTSLPRLAAAAACGAGATALTLPLCESPAPTSLTASRPPVPLTSSTLADAAAAVAPALVHLTVSRPARLLGSVQHGGSGFIIESSGTILTNCHVVRNAAELEVTLHDGVTKLHGVVTHADPISDLAVVKVEPAAPLPVATLGSSSELRPGDLVVALGAPAGLSNSVSFGIVSSIERTRSELGMSGASRDTTGYIQTDAAINMGNSGGPLINVHGEVIGVNSMKAMGVENIAFAVQIDEVKRVMRQLAAHGRVLRPYLGLKFFEVTPHLAENINERVRKERAARHHSEAGGVGGGVILPPTGLHLMHIAPDSPAQQAGLRVGDTIVAMRTAPDAEAVNVTSTKQLVERLSDHVGEHMDLEVWRDGERGRWLRVHVESMQA